MQQSGGCIWQLSRNAGKCHRYLVAMKKKLVLFLLALSLYREAPAAGLFSPRPLFRMRIYTREGNRLDGLLLSITDSQLVIYPGRKKQWKQGITYQPVYYHYRTIESVQLEKPGGFFRKIFSGKRQRRFGLKGSRQGFQLFRQSIDNINKVK